MELPWLMAEYIQVGHIYISQTLFTSFLWLLFFIIYFAIYKFFKVNEIESNFVNITELFIEKVESFFSDLSWWLPVYAKIYITFIFFYILWNNMFWLIGDMFSSVVPSLHHIFRPIATDIYFNTILAIIGVVWAIGFGFYKHWFWYISKYIWYKWLWFVDKVTWPGTFIVKLFDIFLSLFIWILEMIWEVARIASLTLRLFWNIFAWVVLLTLVVWATISFIKIPLILPILIFVVELFISCLQAFVFSLLVLVYFKMAETH